MAYENLSKLSDTNQKGTAVGIVRKSNIGYCIDLLVINKAPAQMIPKNFARIFETYNLFKIKGFSSSMTINDYYVTIGYA